MSLLLLAVCHAIEKAMRKENPDMTAVWGGRAGEGSKGDGLGCDGGARRTRAGCGSWTVRCIARLLGKFSMPVKCQCDMYTARWGLTLAITFGRCTASPGEQDDGGNTAFFLPPHPIFRLVHPADPVHPTNTPQRDLFSRLPKTARRPAPQPPAKDVDPRMTLRGRFIRVPDAAASGRSKKKKKICI